MVNIPDQDGGSSDPGGGTPPGSSTGGGAPAAVPNLANLPTTGGLVGTTTQMLAVGFDLIAQQNLVYVIDPNNHNCEELVEYDFKVEEFEPGNEATIHRIAIRYRDFGPVTFTIAILSATAPNIDYTLGTGNAQLISFGGNGPNKTATGKIYTFLASLKVTTEAPQVKVFRGISAGSLCITKLRGWASYGDGDII
jgi:hypothetical protein